MIRTAHIALVLLVLTNHIGCALCSTPFDWDYVTFGSKTPRSDMRYGRIGSPLSDPAMTGSATSGNFQATAVESIELQAVASDYSDVLESSTEESQEAIDDSEFVSVAPKQVAPSKLKKNQVNSGTKPSRRVIRDSEKDDFFDRLPKS